MGLTLTSAPAAEPITLAEARAQCRIDGTDDDTLLGIYIAAARGKAEQYTGRRLITQTWAQTLDAFPTWDDPILLEVSPVASISSLTYVDTAGATQTLSSGAYVLDTGRAVARLTPTPGTDWPTADDRPNAVTVTMVAGYGAAGSAVPSDLRAWMLLTIAMLFEQRAAVDLTGKLSEIPSRFVDSLLDPHIVYGLS